LALRLGFKRLGVKRSWCAARLAAVPQFSQAGHFLVLQSSLDLPVSDCLANDFARRRVFASIDSSAEFSNLICRERDA
jgi:hypothetical protein